MQWSVSTLSCIQCPAISAVAFHSAAAACAPKEGCSQCAVVAGCRSEKRSCDVASSQIPKAISSRNTGRVFELKGAVLPQDRNCLMGACNAVWRELVKTDGGKGRK